MKKISVYFILILWFTIILFLYAERSFAQLTNKDLPDREGIKLGEMIVHSAFKTEEEFDTNIYLADSDTKHDFITILSPSLGIEIPLRNNRISADYEVSGFLYGDWHNENHIDHRLRGLAEIELADYKVTVKDTYRIFTNRASNENSLRLKQVINDFRTAVEAQFELLGFDVGYTNRLEMYASNDLAYQSLTYEDRNRFKNIIDATVSYRFLPKTLLLLENDFGLIHYYNTSQVPGSYYDETVLGIKGEWFSKINVNFKAGLRYQSYNKSDVIADKDYIGPVLRGGFDYYITEDDTVTFALERTVYESTYSNMNYYNANVAALNYKHRFNDKISGEVFGSYQLHLYPSETTENGVTAKRYDEYLGGGMSLRYNIRKWISVLAKYEYVQRVSQFDVFDYIDNIVTVGGTIGF